MPRPGRKEQGDNDRDDKADSKDQAKTKPKEDQQKLDKFPERSEPAVQFLPASLGIIIFFACLFWIFYLIFAPTEETKKPPEKETAVQERKFLYGKVRQQVIIVDDDVWSEFRFPPPEFSFNFSADKMILVKTQDGQLFEKTGTELFLIDDNGDRKSVKCMGINIISPIYFRSKYGIAEITVFYWDSRDGLPPGCRL